MILHCHQAQEVYAFSPKVTDEPSIEPLHAPYSGTSQP